MPAVGPACAAALAVAVNLSLALAAAAETPVRKFPDPPSKPTPSSLPNATVSDGTTANPSPAEIAQVPEPIAPPPGPGLTEPHPPTINQSAPSPGSAIGDAGSSPLR